MRSAAEYKAQGSLGSGFFGTVAVGVDPTTGQSVAIKFLKLEHLKNEAYRERFAREIRITAELSDLDGVVPILHDGGSANRPFYVMPRADCDLLKYVRTNNSTLSDDERIAICQAVVQTMAEAHAKGILHRDISPRNVLVFDTNNPVFCVTDFGLGKTEDEVIALTSSSDTGYGAPLYVAPELLSATTRSDVYSLGRLIDFIVTGKDPDNVKSHWCSPVSRKASQVDPRDRFENAGELLEALCRQRDLVFGTGVDDLTSFMDLQDMAVGEESWEAVHRFLVNGSYKGKAYYQYLDPVIDFFATNDRRLDQYARVVGDAFDEFAMRFVSEIQICGQELGWPFSASRRFYDLLERIFPKCNALDAKRECFSAFWQDAYVADQWSAQASIKHILVKVPLDLATQAEFASVIAERGGRVVDDSVLAAAPKGPIRNAIRNIMQQRDAR